MSKKWAGEKIGREALLLALVTLAQDELRNIKT